MSFRKGACRVDLLSSLRSRSKCQPASGVGAEKKPGGQPGSYICNSEEGVPIFIGWDLDSRRRGLVV